MTMRPVRCPTCKRLFDGRQSPAMPFCSERCRLIDVGRWLREEYGLPCEPEKEPPEEGAEPREPDGE